MHLYAVWHIGERHRVPRSVRCVGAAADTRADLELLGGENVRELPIRRVLHQRDEPRAVRVVLEPDDLSGVSPVPLEVDDSQLPPVLGRHPPAHGYLPGVVATGLVLPTDTLRERLLRPTAPKPRLINRYPVSQRRRDGLVMLELTDGACGEQAGWLQ